MVFTFWLIRTGLLAFAALIIAMCPKLPAALFELKTFVVCLRARLPT